MNIHGTLNTSDTVNTDYLNLSLLRFAADEIKRVEQMLIKGEDKLKAVLSHVRGVYESTSGPQAFGIEFDMFEQKMADSVNALVAYYNDTGTFTQQPQLKQA